MLIRLSLLLLLASPYTLPAQQQGFEELGRKAIEAAQAGRYADAIRGYRRMLELDPSNAEVRYDLALVLYRGGQPLESLRVLGAPKQADALALAGANYRAVGKPAVAVTHLRRAYALAPSADVAYDLGLTLLDLGKDAEAEQVFRRFPEDPRSLVGLGLAAYKGGRNEQAEIAFRKAAEKEPQAPDIRTSLGDVHFATGRFAEAAEAYTEAMRLDPRNAGTRVKAGRNLLRLNQTAEARKLFEEAIRLNPMEGDARFELGRMMAASEGAAALPHLETAIAADPMKAASYYQLGLLHRRLGNAAEAEGAMKRFDMLRKEDGPLRVQMHDASLLSEGPPGEQRWGRYQFPTMHRMEDGRLIAFVHVEADSATSYGMPKRVYTSADDGLSWREDPEAVRQAYGLRVGPGEWLRIDTPPSLEAKDLALPEPAGAFTSYKQPYSLYPMRELPADLRRIFFQRFRQGAWVRESTPLEDPGGMRYTTAGRFPRIWWGDARRLRDGSLLAVTYPTILEGKAPFHFSASSWRSVDGGRKWGLQGRIPYQPDEQADPLAEKRDGFTEPAFEVLADGSLYAVLRTSDGNGLGPMYAARSRDLGRHWSRPAVIAPSGVMPRLLRLGNGILVLASGRPGVQLRFSLDGRGDTWTGPYDLLPITSTNAQFDSCGYTDLLPVEDGSFVVVYSWFRKPDADGKPRKVVLARRVRVIRAGG